MAPKPLSPIEALAKRQVKPITPAKTGVVKQAAPPPTPPKSAAQEYLDSLKQPQTNVVTPTAAATNVAGNKPFVGPTLDPEVIQARSKLKSTELKALQAGVDPARVAAIAAGEPDPNRGFIGLGKGLLGGAKAFGGFFAPDWADPTNIPLPGTDKNLGEAVATPAKAIGKGALGLAAGPIFKLSTPFRFISSTLKEVGDELADWRGTRKRGVSIDPKTGNPYDFGAGGFSLEDWYNQTFAGAFGLGDKYKADDPAIIAEATQYENMTPKKLAEIKNQDQAFYGGEAFAGIENAYLNQALGFIFDVGLDPLTYGTGIGGIAKGAAAKGLLVSGSRGVKIAERFAAVEKSALKATLKKTIAQEARDAALAAGDNVAAEVAENSIKVAEKELAKAAARATADAPVRGLGEGTKRALAIRVLQLKDDALGFVERANQAGVAGLTVTQIDEALKTGTLADDLARAGFQPEEITEFAARYAEANQFVKAITPEVIKNIQRSGLSGLAPALIDAAKVKAPIKAATGLGEKIKAIPEAIKAIPQISPFLTSVKAGTRTAAQEALGVRGGYRFFNPLEPFGVGPKTFTPFRPITEPVFNVLGKLAAGARVNITKGTKSAGILNKLQLTTNGGILLDEDLLKVRVALKTGNLSAEEAQLLTRLLDIDNRYRSIVSNERLQAAGTLRKSGVNNFDDKVLDSVLPYLQKDPADWATAKLPTMNDVQKRAYNTVRNLMEGFFDYTSKVSGGTGFVPGRITNYFPQLQTSKAINWMRRNPKEAEKLAKKLGVDRTWFLGNFRERSLKADDIWFGHKLKPEDINVTTLNDFARNPMAGSGITGLKFDFFETNVKTALQKYVDKHAQFAAFQRALGEAPERAPELFVRGTTIETPRLTAGGDEILDAKGIPVIDYDFVDPKVVSPALPPAEVNKLVRELGLGRPAIPGVLPAVSGRLSLEALTAASPQKLQELLTQLKDLTASMRAPAVIKESFEQQIDVIKKTIDDLNATAALLDVDARTRALEVYRDFGSLQIRQVLDELSRAPFDIPPAGAKWSEYVDYVGKGVKGLNPETLPDIGAKKLVADMLQNAQRLSDKEFAGKTRQFIQWYTGWSKANYTASLGFHLKNSVGNVFQFIVAGGDPINGINGGTIFKSLQRKIKRGLTVREAVLELVEEPGFVTKFLQDAPGLKGLTRPKAQGVQQFNQLVNAIEEAFNLSGNVGFGQFGEVGTALGAKPRGFLLRETPSRVPVVKQAGDAYAWLMTKNRQFGTEIENFNRFGLMWDGLVKGLSPQEAAARVDKYLLNYQEYSKLDKAARSVFPFWTFMSRNAPLAFQFSFTNPKAYAWYNSFKRNLEGPSEEEGGITIPDYEKERGLFATKEEGFGALLPGTVFKPSLPFQGAGETVLSQLISEPQSLLGNVNPLFRVPLETASAVIQRQFDPELGQFGGRGYTFFTGAPVVSRQKETTGKTTEELARYLTVELTTPSSPLKRIIAAIPSQLGGDKLRESMLADFLGIRVDENQPELQELQALYNWSGLPFANIKTSSQRREVERRIYEIARLLDAKESSKYYERKEKQKAAQETLPPESGAPQQKSAAQQYLDSLNPSSTTP